ncbi:tetratricopeptide repeat protein [Marinicellulosiphila megalodicopiae]|uniref:tetratricopeptide repeat protein n=1 Tax=Marinicellulosiphila megalodicopiae TaxID=2724896 RepID=UPI003BAF36D6
MLTKKTNKNPCLVLVLSSFLLWSCQSQVASKKQDNAPNFLQTTHSSDILIVSRDEKNPTQTSEPLVPVTPLDAQSFKEFLLAELAYQQQDYSGALALYYLLAKRVNDPNIAKKGAQIAAYLNQDMILAQMLDIWLAVYPEDQEALMLGLSNSLTMGDFVVFEARFHKIMQENPRFNLFALLRALPVNIEAFVELEKLLVRLQHQYHHPQLYTVLSFVMEHQGKFEKSLEMGNQGINEFDNPMVRMLMIKTYQVLGQNEKADDLLEQSYEIYTSDRKIAEARIQLAWARSEFETAYHMTRQMYERQPGDPNLAYQYARLALKQKDWIQAKLVFETLLIYPTLEDEMNYNLGVIANEQKEFELAMRYFSKVKPSNYYKNAQYFRANIVWRARSNAQDVVDIFEQLLINSEEEQKVDVIILEAEFWSAIQQYQIGLDRIEKSVRNYPDNLGLQYQYSLMLDSAGQVEKSLSILIKLLEKKPNDADVLNAYGYVLGNRTDQVDLAITYVEKSLQIEPENPATLDSMGWLLYKQNRYEEALGYLTQAFEQYQHDEVAAHLGAVLWKLGQQQKAQDVWQQGYDLQPNSAVITEIKQQLDAL